MAAPVYHKIQNNTFWLLVQKALFWEEQKTLILSDLHIGKTGHFRKEGIAVPQGVYKDDLHRLFHIIQQYKPDQLIIAGDMFHSKMNKEIDLFARWRKDVSQLYIQLIKGNHDVLHDEHYALAGIAVNNCSLQVDRFCFVHDIEDVKNEKPNAKNETPTLDNADGRHYYFSGHVHPGVVLKTGSRQSICLPCYYFTAQYAVLPAFSAFTGMYPVAAKKQDDVFAIMKDNVMRI
jgi:DNA ligase-associated metallophosphoesterase